MFRFTLFTALLLISLEALAIPLKTGVGRNAEIIQLYQFPNETWIENLAVRADNQLLLGDLTLPNLYLLDPSKKESPTLIHQFDNATAVFGIAEYEPDVFAVGAGNFSLTEGNVPGSYSVYKVDFTCSPPSVSLIAHAPQVNQLNGVCTLPYMPGYILLGDLYGGQIFRLDIATGTTKLVVPPTNPLVGLGYNSVLHTAGVDGIFVLNDTLYVANGGTGIFGTLRINADGTPAEDAQPVTLAYAANGTYWDDFAVTGQGEVYAVTGSGNTIVEFGTGLEEVVAGDLNSTLLAMPTSARLSRGSEEGKWLYVTTGGGELKPVNGDEIVGGQVIAIHLI